MLNLWWGLTEQTYLYYWHQNVWSVLVAWATVVLVIVLTILVGAALWRAGYRAVVRSAGPVDASTRQEISRPAPVPADSQPSTQERRFLAPPSEAFPGVRGFISRHRSIQD
jgi:membrane-bound metal-dependent hydrolase YbcI (DUF457 family)